MENEQHAAQASQNRALLGISYPAARDASGALHWATDASKGQQYLCVGCDAAMVLRGGRRRRHFAHKPGSHCTAPETALHRLVKLTISEQFRAAVSAHRPYPLGLRCDFCGIEHERNLVKRATTIKAEVKVNGIVPDLSIYDADDKLLAAIEVVVTHLPSQATEKAYEAMGIPVMLVFPQWRTVEKLRERVWADVLINSASLCPKWLNHFHDLELRERHANEMVPPAFDDQNKCPTCQQPLQVRLARLYTGYICQRCSANNRVATFSSSWNNFPRQENLSALLRRLGVRAERTSSKTVGWPYLMNVCAKCGWKFGDFYLTTEVASLPEHENRALGYCETCHVWFAGKCKAVGHHNPTIRHQLQARPSLGKFSIPYMAEPDEYIDRLRHRDDIRELG